MSMDFPGYQTILLATDFSNHCEHAARHAAWLAAKSGGTVHFAHVVANPLDPIYEPEEVPHWVAVEQSQRKACELLEARANECLPADVRRELHVVSGDPAEKLLELIGEVRADLVVMSTHGRSDLVHLLIGSVAERVARHATCPVLLVRRPD